MKMLPTAFLHEALIYDSVSGELFWRKRPREHFNDDRGWRVFNTRYAEKQAGTVGKTTGYVYVNFASGDLYAAHRLIWAMTTGEWPDFIDHINGDRADNRLENIRPCSRSQNQCNRGVQKNNSSGFKGVHRHTDGRWRARIKAGGKHIHLGLFDTPSLAHQAYLSATLRYHGKFAYAVNR